LETTDDDYGGKTLAQRKHWSILLGPLFESAVPAIEECGVNEKTEQERTQHTMQHPNGYQISNLQADQAVKVG